MKAYGVALKCGYLVNKYPNSTEWYWSGMHGQKLSYRSGNGAHTTCGVHLKWCWSVCILVSNARHHSIVVKIVVFVIKKSNSVRKKCICFFEQK